MPNCDFLSNFIFSPKDTISFVIRLQSHVRNRERFFECEITVSTTKTRKIQSNQRTANTERHRLTKLGPGDYHALAWFKKY